MPDTEPILDNEGKPLQHGTVLKANKDSYVLEALVGEGGFGAVYRAIPSRKPDQQYAVKIERKHDPNKRSKINMEILILKAVAACPTAVPNRRCHFTSIVDRGRLDNFSFVIMDLVGRSLDELHRRMPKRIFSMPTAFAVGIQTLEALEDLHNVGFVHRDIKAANYACGLGSKTRLIYILDFGIARKFLHKNQKMRAPRCQINFKGTVRYASLSCHRNREIGPKDDCESWFYMLLESMHPRGLPWRQLTERHSVHRYKEICRVGAARDRLLPPWQCRPELGAIVDYIDRLQYIDRVDYDYVYKMLKQCAKIEKVDMCEPYDWENPIPDANTTNELDSEYSDMETIGSDFPPDCPIPYIQYSSNFRLE